MAVGRMETKNGRAWSRRYFWQKKILKPRAILYRQRIFNMILPAECFYIIYGKEIRNSISPVFHHLGNLLAVPPPPPNPLKDFQFPLSWGCGPMSPPYSKLLTIKTQEWPWVSDFKHKKLLHTQMTLLKLFLINHPSQHFAINSIHFCEAQQRECFYNLVLLRRHCLLVLLHLGLFVHWSKNYLPFHSLKSVRRKFWKKNQA